MGQRCGPPILVRMEQEELALRPHMEIIPHSLCLRQHFFQNISGIALEHRSVRLIYVADQSRHLSLLRPPRKYHKCIQIQIQIRILYPGKSFYGRAVKHNLIVQRLF